MASKAKWLTRGALVFLAVLICSAIFTYRQLYVIDHYASCMTYRSAAGAPFDQRNRAQLKSYFSVHHFSLAFASDTQAEWDTPTVFATWSEEPGLWLSICARTEDSCDWIAVSDDVQKILLQLNVDASAWVALGSPGKRSAQFEGKALPLPVDTARLKQALACKPSYNQ